jgi:hypothetical protein
MTSVFIIKYRRNSCNTRKASIERARAEGALPASPFAVINETGTSGPKGQRIWLIDVRAKARTYPRASFSAACKAMPFVQERNAATGM